MANTILNWYMATSLPLDAGVEISETYVGAATEETPIPRPPIKRKKENIYGPVAKAEPIDDIVKRIPIQISTFFCHISV
jgi:hypothetical protein